MKELLKSENPIWTYDQHQAKWIDKCLVMSHFDLDE